MGIKNAKGTLLKLGGQSLELRKINGSEVSTKRVQKKERQGKIALATVHWGWGGGGGQLTFSK